MQAYTSIYMYMCDACTYTYIIMYTHVHVCNSCSALSYGEHYIVKSMFYGTLKYKSYMYMYIVYNIIPNIHVQCTCLCKKEPLYMYCTCTCIYSNHSASYTIYKQTPEGYPHLCEHNIQQPKYIHVHACIRIEYM